MFDIDLAAIEDHLELICSDAPSMEAFKARNPNLIALFKAIVGKEPAGASSDPFPPIGAMTAIQTALFDNWPKGAKVKGRPNRYGLAVEVWTASADAIQTNKLNNCQYKATAYLMSGTQMAKNIATRADAKKWKRPLSQAFVDHITAQCAAMGPSDLIGLLATKNPAMNEGTTYHDGQFVFIPGGVEGEDTAAFLVTGMEQENTKLLPRFSRYQPDGQTKHSGSVILQSRADLAGFSSSWGTKPWE